MTEGGNRSGRRVRRRVESARGARVEQDSDSKRRVEHPADDSAAATATGGGTPSPGAVPATGTETPSARGPTEGAGHPVPCSPGPALVNGQRSVRPKAYSLIDKVYSWNNLRTAWRRVRANKGAHGLDRVTIRDFEADWETHLNEIQRKLKQDRFEPQPVRRVYIPKPGDPSARRPLGVPVVADRVVQQAITSGPRSSLRRLPVGTELRVPERAQGPPRHRHHDPGRKGRLSACRRCRRGRLFRPARPSGDDVPCAAACRRRSRPTTDRGFPQGGCVRSGGRLCPPARHSAGWCHLTVDG